MKTHTDSGIMDKIEVQIQLTSMETVEVLELLQSTDGEYAEIVFEKKVTVADRELKLQVISDCIQSWMWITMSDKYGRAVSSTEQMFLLDLSYINLDNKHFVKILPFSDALYPRLSSVEVGLDYRYGVLEDIFIQENDICRKVDVDSWCEDWDENKFEMLDVTNIGEGGIGQSFLVITDKSGDAVLSFVMTGYSNTSIWTCCYKHPITFANE